MRQQAFASPEEALEHFGTKGMRWGIRKERENTGRPTNSEIANLASKPIVRHMSNGDQLTLSSRPPYVLKRLVGRVSAKTREETKNSVFMDISDKDGKRIGTCSFHNRNAEEMHLTWLTISKSARGQGYATEIMKGAEEFGKRTGKKKMTLDVPVEAADARHIYEKMGFKVDTDPEARKRMGDENVPEGEQWYIPMVYHFNENQ